MPRNITATSLIHTTMQTKIGGAMLKAARTGRRQYITNRHGEPVMSVHRIKGAVKAPCFQFYGELQKDITGTVYKALKMATQQSGVLNKAPTKEILTLKH